MIKIGLTGGMASGKTATASIFREMGVPIYDADGVVHELYKNELVADIEKICPTAIVNNIVDREQLKLWLRLDINNLKILEDLVHPHVERRRHDFIEITKKKGSKFCVFDVPLLFEIGLNQHMDVIIITYADNHTIKKRLRTRYNHNEIDHSILNNRQFPIEYKIRNSHYIINTNNSFDYTISSVKNILRSLA